MARYSADTISQIKRHGWWVRVICRCGNNKTMRPVELENSSRKVTGHTTIEQLRGILKCKLCGARPWDVHFTFKPETRP